MYILTRRTKYRLTDLNTRPTPMSLYSILLYYPRIIHINLPLVSLYLLNKPYQNPLPSF